MRKLLAGGAEQQHFDMPSYSWPNQYTRLIQTTGASEPSDAIPFVNHHAVGGAQWSAVHVLRCQLTE